MFVSNRKGRMRPTCDVYFFHTTKAYLSGKRKSLMHEMFTKPFPLERGHV